MGKKRLFSAVATLIGCIIGAGILGIPYVVAKAGFLTGLLDIVLIGLFFLLINIYLGEVTLRTKGSHQLAFYAEKYLGRNGRRLMFISTLVGIYGALVAYMIGQGAALSQVTGWNDIISTTVMFALLSFLVYIGLRAVSKAESYIVPVVLLLTVAIAVASLGKIDLSRLSFFDPSKVFVPFGVIFFSFIGVSAIPSVKDELETDGSQVLLKKAIIIGSVIPIFIYILFSLAMVGVMGESVNQIAALSFGSLLGEQFSALGSVFAMLTMTTSFLALGLALKGIFEEDYGLSNNKSWSLTCVVPFLIYVLLQFAELDSFMGVLDVTGVVTGVITAMLIILMAFVAKKSGDRVPEYSVFMSRNLAIVLIVLLIIGGIVKLAF